MNKLSILLLTLGAALTLAGCANTVSGVKQDTAADTEKTRQAAADAGKAVAAVPQDAEANAVRIPVKTAILRDPVLTDSRNLISVDGRDHTITLSGHVAEARMKERATEDAKVALEKHPGYTLSNELTVAGAAPAVQ